MAFVRIPLWDKQFGLRGVELRAHEPLELASGSAPSLWSAMDALDLARARQSRAAPEIFAWSLDERLWEQAAELTRRPSDSLANLARVLGDCRAWLAVPCSALRADRDVEAVAELSKALAARGAGLLLSDFRLEPRPIAALSRCAGASLSARGAGLELCKALAPKLRKAGKLLWVSGVDAPADAALFSAAGATLMSGRAPWERHNGPAARFEIDPRRVLSALSLACSEADASEIEREIKLDPALAYKFIAMLNSPGLRRGPEGVASVSQGVALLGRDNLAQWLSLLLLRSAGARCEMSALRWGAAARARLCEEIAKAGPDPKLSGAAFVCGVFSGLESAMGPSLSAMLADSDMPEPIQLALGRGAGPLGATLALAKACEDPEGLRSEAAEALRACAVDRERLNAMRRDAFHWANASSF